MNKHLYLVTRFALAVLCFAGVVFSALPAASHAAGPLVDTDWLNLHKGDANLVIVDLRAADDFAYGHIPGSVNAPYGKFGWREKVGGVVGMLPPLKSLNERIGKLGITPESQVVLVPYGDSSSDVGAGTRVYWTLKLLGHKPVAVLDGGLKSWRSQPVYVFASGPNTELGGKAYPGEVDARQVIDTDELSASIGKKEVVPVDARPDAQWGGQKKHPKARIAGAIPEAKRLPQAELVDPETGKFRSREEILSVATKYGWQPNGNSSLVAYCNTGHWASIAWFALSEIAGFGDVRLYDGSMVAWTRNPDLPLINEPSYVEQIKRKILGS